MASEKINWVGLKAGEISTLISICNAVAWEKKLTEKLKIDALAMAIRLESTFKRLTKI